MVFEQDYLHKEILFNRFKDEHLKPNILLETSQFSTILSLVQQGTAVSFVLKDVVEEWMKIKYIPISPQLNLDIRMIWRSDDYMFQSMKDFIHLLETMDKETDKGIFRGVVCLKIAQKNRQQSRLFLP